MLPVSVVYMVFLLSANSIHHHLDSLTTYGFYFSDIPTKLDDFLEFQWKQGVEFLSHQPGYLDGEYSLVILLV